MQFYALNNANLYPQKKNEFVNTMLIYSDVC